MKALARLVPVLGLVLAVATCGGNPETSDDTVGGPPCSDNLDNDGDGAVDFPDDPGCISESDDTEDSPASPQCNDGRDNDGDGLEDFPFDPGCAIQQQDTEDDDCPDGPNCPQCGNGRDDDMNGMTDFPDDPGCASAGDGSEVIENPVACGQGLKIKQLPGTGLDMGMLDGSSTSQIVSPCGGGGGAPAIAYLLLLTEPKVIVASTDSPNTQANTVIDIRSADCDAASSHITCSDDITAMNVASSVTASLDAGTYYIIVQGANAGAFGAFSLQVQQFAGEGTACADAMACGPGLVCRVPVGQSAKVCTEPVCSDGRDDDADGKLDYPLDPGCASPIDDTEGDDCPDGPNCPACSDGDDNDADTMTDFPNDATCSAAASPSEPCVSREPVVSIFGRATKGDTTNATNEYDGTCNSTTSMNGRDVMFHLDLPPTTTLSISTTKASGFSIATALLNSTCGGTAIRCTTGTNTHTNLPGGTYFLAVDGYADDDFGPFTLNVTGVIAAKGSCEGPLFASGALTCVTGTTCDGTPGTRTCRTACSDGIDNNGDGKMDFPNDPACSNMFDNTEDNVCPGANCPQCGDGVDNDGDARLDFPADYACASASGAVEAFCAADPDFGGEITMPTTNGTLVGAADNFDPSCQSSTAADRTYALVLPVPVATIQIDTTGSTIADTVLTVKDAQCDTQLRCDDDTSPGSSAQSQITITNLAAGTYAIGVDSYQSGTSTSNVGPFVLNVKGTVAPQTACTSPLFASGVLACPTGTSCTAGKCQ